MAWYKTCDVCGRIIEGTNRKPEKYYSVKVQGLGALAYYKEYSLCDKCYDHIKHFVKSSLSNEQAACSEK